ncbi:hypothetical protein LINGRAHAP2_LOCUS29001 [Linum grandiflorum]
MEPCGGSPFSSWPRPPVWNPSD